jgi:hypothetical protein
MATGGDALQVVPQGSVKYLLSFPGRDGVQSLVQGLDLPEQRTVIVVRAPRLDMSQGLLYTINRLWAVTGAKIDEQPLSDTRLNPLSQTVQQFFE